MERSGVGKQTQRFVIILSKLRERLKISFLTGFQILFMKEKDICNSWFRAFELPSIGVIVLSSLFHGQVGSHPGRSTAQIEIPPHSRPPISDSLRKKTGNSVINSQDFFLDLGR
jgi:hypothetical protein